MVSEDQLVTIYTSQTFPTTGYGVVYNLTPELQEKIQEAFFSFDWEGSALAEEFSKSGEAQFIPITFKEDWAVIRQIDEANGVSYTCRLTAPPRDGVAARCGGCRTGQSLSRSRPRCCVSRRWPSATRPVITRSRACRSTVDKGQVVGLIGPSGAGKSTLIRCVNRLVEPTGGEVFLNDTDLTAAQRRRSAPGCAGEIGMIFQEYALVERLTVMENVLSGRLGYVLLLAQPAPPLSTRPISTRRSRCSSGSASPSMPTSAPTSSRAASASASASPARSSRTPSCCWSTSRPHRSIPRPRGRSCG